MNPRNAVLILVEDVADRIRAATAPWGTLTLAFSEPDNAIGVVGFAERDQGAITDWRDLNGLWLGSVDSTAAAGLWYRCQPELNAAHRQLVRIGVGLPTDAFGAMLDSGLQTPPQDGAIAVVTHARNAPVEWAAWAVSRDQVVPAVMTVLNRPDSDPLTTLGNAWPRADVAAASLTLVGAGSIGSALAHALAAYGVGHLTLVDPDRLVWGNLVRHRCRRRDVGRYKVDALADDLRERWPGLTVDPSRTDVIVDADQMRPLFARSNLIVCAADGVAARRVVSHLARRTSTTVVLACVLLDGAIGEVLRLRPWPGYGCLLCQRAELVAQGCMDPEPSLDREYGTGERHRPMTAVGSDLHLVGQFAAKVAVATLLEDAGHQQQRIDAEYALIGLRPDVIAAAPFDVPQSQVRWLSPFPDRPNCPTCAAA